MKRGFMDRNLQFLPPELLKQRREKFSAGFKEYGIDAAVIYGDVASADELQYLTNLGPYWANATAVILKDGTTFFVTGLSARVDQWVAMITGSGLDSIIAAGPKLNTKVAAVLKEKLGATGTIGITGKYFPAEMSGAIEKAGFKTVFYNSIPDEQLTVRDQAYQAMLLEGIGLMNKAVSAVLNNPATYELTKKRIAAEVEYACRTAGAMDVIILSGDDQLVFGHPEEVADQNSWTLYVQIQYLGEWFAVARNMKHGNSVQALTVRDQAAKELKPGLDQLSWNQDGYNFSVCTKVLSDHISYQNENNSVLKENQIVSLKVEAKNEGIYLEDMFRITAQGGQLLTIL
jgi:Xaa-Pro aminopeptidase